MPNILKVLNAQAARVARARQLVEADRQLIRIGVSSLIGLATLDLLTEPFLRDNPKTEIVVRAMNLAEMTQMLQSGQLVFVFGRVAQDLAPSPEWQMVRLHHEPLVHVGKGQTAVPLAEVVLADLVAETFVLVPDACGLTRTTCALLQASGPALREYPGQAMIYRVLQDWARIGVGSAILPASRVEPATRAPIVLFCGQSGGVAITCHALWRSGAERPPEADRFAWFLSEVAPAILAGLVWPGGSVRPRFTPATASLCWRGEPAPPARVVKW